jgi:hypothetical protein
VAGGSGSALRPAAQRARVVRRVHDHPVYETKKTLAQPILTTCTRTSAPNAKMPASSQKSLVSGSMRGAKDLDVAGSL